MYLKAVVVPKVAVVHKNTFFTIIQTGLLQRDKENSSIYVVT